LHARPAGHLRPAGRRRGRRVPRSAGGGPHPEGHAGRDPGVVRRGGGGSSAGAARVIVTVLLALPLLGAAVLLLVRARPLAEAGHVAAALATAAAAATVAREVWRTGGVTGGAWALRADPLSAFMACIVAGVALVAALAVPGYLRVEHEAGMLQPAREAVFRPLFQLFVFTMLLAVTTDNVGLMWVAIEGTTLASVFLITLERTRASLEAAYKYLLIGSVGIGMAFVGTVLVYHADLRQLGEAER